MSAVDEETHPGVTEPEPEGEPEPDDAEEPEGEPEPEPEPETEPEPELRSDKDLEKAFASLDKEATRHANRLSEIMGEDAQGLLPCELCEPQFAGFRFPVEVDEDKRGRVLAAIGLASLGDVPDDDEAQMCDRCNGEGKTLTGSKVPEQITRPCTKCGANGWTTRQQRNEWDSARATRDEVARITAEPVQGLAVVPDLPSADAWGRALGTQFYGMNPQYMTPAQISVDVPSVQAMFQPSPSAS